MDKRLTFNEDPQNYDIARPQYTDALYRAIFTYANLQPKDSVIEVGSGAGQATLPFLQYGCRLTAIELGADLAAYTKKKFAGYENFCVENTAFEDFTRPAASADLLFSATAFHWVPESIGYPKAFSLLKPGGTIALFWNRPYVCRKTDPVHMAIQEVYDAHRDACGFASADDLPPEHDTNRYSRLRNILIYYGFTKVECHLYHATRELSAKAYTALLDTYSDHRSLPENLRTAFNKDMEEAITAHGGKITIYDTMDLYLGKRP